MMQFEIVLVTVVGLLVYMWLGLGVANSERHARGQERNDVMTVLFWPLALLIFSFDAGLGK